MSYLDNINSPSDLKKLNIDELSYLAEEIREFLIKSLSKTGGHLASNLGVIELTIALNYCFDFSKDKIIWDVGHQAYTHKVLTGRKNLFDTLRKKDGLSGFPKTEESIYDHFNTGHSSTSISASLGFAAARDLLGKDYNVVSVIGDGAMTGGLVYEAMNNAGANNKKLLIILNDNQMSISENVGSMSKHLSRLRSAPEYIEAKLDV
ncbi:MAG: 1-deoxy-D-xylulose-5-phosphate synthase, partial [Clostridiales bacterium]|nr:1-deoxy-D-xylulose-5-phosphate synthase [Clostridiales bacterium]